MKEASYKWHVLYNSLFKNFLENDIKEDNSSCLRLRGRNEDWLYRAQGNFFKWVSVLKLDCDVSYRSKFTKTIHLITGECYFIIWKLYCNKGIEKG